MAVKTLLILLILDLLVECPWYNLVNSGFAALVKSF